MSQVKVGCSPAQARSAENSALQSPTLFSSQPVTQAALSGGPPAHIGTITKSQIASHSRHGAGTL